MAFIKEHELEKLRSKWPKGSRIKCLNMPDDPQAIPPGSEGTVTHVDDIGSIHVRWDNGSSLALLYGVDEYCRA